MSFYADVTVYKGTKGQFFVFSVHEHTLLRLTNPKKLIFEPMRYWIIILWAVAQVGAKAQKTVGLEPVPFSRPLMVEHLVDSLTVYTPQGNKKTVKAVNPDSIPLYEFIPIQRGDNLLFVNYIGGHVLEWNNDTIRRIDYSYDHRNQLNSAIFQRNDTIFRFGGYGFFESRNFFTYFDYKTKEWNAYKTSVGPEPPGLSGVKYFVDAEGFYLFGGNTIDPHDKFLNHPNPEIWYFSFASKQWTLKGRYEQLTRLEGRNSDFQLGNKLFFFLTDRMFCFDVTTGTFMQHPINSAYNSVIFNKPVFVDNGLLKFFIRPNNDSKVELLFEVDAEQAMANPMVIENAYDHNGKYWFAGGLALVIFVGFITWLLLRRRVIQELTLDQQLLNFKRKSIPLTPEEAGFMQLFLQQVEVEVSDLLEVLQETKVVYSQKMRIKEEIIQGLNNKLYLLTGTKDFEIVSKKSKADKRMKVYRLKKRE